MRLSYYLQRYDHILELEVLEELAKGDKEKKIAKLMGDIYRVLESPIHQHQENMKAKDVKELGALYSKIVLESKW